MPDIDYTQKEHKKQPYKYNITYASTKILSHNAIIEYISENLANLCVFLARSENISHSSLSPDSSSGA